MAELYGPLLLLLICIIVYLLYRKGRRSIINEKKYIYKKALKSGDKAAALNASREYYAALRGGMLTIYDEQAIANDLATIK